MTWVERVFTKQADLELDHMVMVSSSGSTAGAVAKARYYAIELVTPERPIPGRASWWAGATAPGVSWPDSRTLICISGQISRAGESQTIPLPAGAAVFDAEGIAQCSVAELVEIFLDGAELREVVAQAPGQSVESRVRVCNFVLRRDEDGDPIEVFIGAPDGQLLCVTDFDAVLSARVEARPVLLARVVCTLRACRPLRAFVQTTSETDLVPKPWSARLVSDRFRDAGRADETKSPQVRP
ncbi:hypothetical protein [Nonomuraea sp. NPDC001831]|uniref:hypothetical protein n=1 Tax=Nonomuraea sp. NPDC001831 TaxID=3364340 RepID=UPI0036C24680